MIKRIAILGLVLPTVFALAGASAVSVSATGHEFIASRVGKTKSAGASAQIFETGAGTIECTQVSGTGKIKELRSVVHKETLTYSECTGYGGIAIKISAVHFEFDADGSARLEKTVTVTPEGVGCVVHIEPQTFESLGYTNGSGATVTAQAEVTKIRTKGSGGPCGGEDAEGSYTGSMTAELEGGTVEWK